MADLSQTAPTATGALGRGSDIKRQRRIRRAIWYALILAIVIWCAMVPVRDGNLSIYFAFMLGATMATGLNFVAGFTGYMPFGYVAFYGLGSYVTGIAVKLLGIPVYLAVPMGGCAGILLALAFAPTLRLSGIYFAIVSLSLAIILQRSIALMPEEITGGSLGMNIGVLTDRIQGYYAMLVVLVMALLTASWLAESRLGRSLKAIREDAEAADAMGVNVVRSRLYAWLVSAFFASLVGGVQAWFTGAFDTFTAFDVLVTAKAIIYAMAGGLGTVIGPVVGTVVLVWADELVWRAFPELNSFLLGLVIALLILFAPRGIIGTLIRRYPRLRNYFM
ncbi:branched-chain amino acid ABC transporter permease [Stappia stellulata]|uniref:branched-chain amino acid ABC transporter permease n=1 Tax=Stappia stellulata TaxID=71235 RepID=UPI001CD673FD|nr:branched-chain amino acid ABC transporter permease [Stappia stellulata]MCA1241479.1 branched-chain amino acid ABC transporter permease [Stappia stellulata]